MAGLLSRMGSGLKKAVGGAAHTVLDTGRAVGDLATGNPDDAWGHIKGAGQGVKDWASGAADATGISNLWNNSFVNGDDDAGDISDNMDDSIERMNQGLKPVEDEFSKAMYNPDGTPKRTLDTNLTKYEGAMDTADKTLAGSTMDPSKIDDYANPMNEQMQDAAVRSANGGAGAALQSSAASRNAARAASGVAAANWNQAANQAQAAAGLNAKIGSEQANLANQRLQNTNEPALDWAQLEEDKAAQALNADVAKTQAGAQKDIAENTGGLFGGGGILGTGIKLF